MVGPERRCRVCVVGRDGGALNRRHANVSEVRAGRRPLEHGLTRARHERVPRPGYGPGVGGAADGAGSLHGRGGLRDARVGMEPSEGLRDTSCQHPLSREAGISSSALRPRKRDAGRRGGFAPPSASERSRDQCPATWWRAPGSRCIAARRQIRNEAPEPSCLGTFVDISTVEPRPRSGGGRCKKGNILSV